MSEISISSIAVIIAFGLIPFSLILHFFLCKLHTKWIAVSHIIIILILSLVFLLANIEVAFQNISSFGEFIIEYRWAGLFALILKSGFVMTPFVLHLIIYWLVHKQQANPNDELKKMIIEDL